MKSRHTDDEYRAAAKKKYHAVGVLEVDNGAKVITIPEGSSSGAYVTAWVWVGDDELEEEEE